MVEIKDIVEALIKDKRAITYGSEYLLARTIDMLSDKKKDTIWYQLSREDDLTSNFFFEYGEAEIYTSGVYFKFAGSSHRTSATYFVDLDGNINRKQRGELLYTEEFSADSGIVNWYKLKGDLTSKEFNNVENQILNVLGETSEIPSLRDSRVEKEIYLNGLSIDSFEIGISHVEKGKLVDIEKYDSLMVNESEYFDFLRLVKNFSIGAILDTYGKDNVIVEAHRKGYAIAVPTSSNFYLVAMIDNIGLNSNTGAYLVDREEYQHALLNLDYVYFDTKYQPYGRNEMSGSTLINLIEDICNEYNTSYTALAANNRLEIIFNDRLENLDLFFDFSGKSVSFDIIRTDIKMIEEIVY